MCRKLLFFLAVIFLFAPAALAKHPDAPFGLSWGMNQKQIKALGIELEKVEEGIFSAEKMPRDMEWADAYALMIDPKAGLVKIIAFTTDITDDRQGQMGRRVYFKLKGELQKDMVLIYSEEKDASTPGITPPPGQSVYACLDEGPCGAWYSNFVKEDISAQVVLEALDADSGFASVIYEHSGLVRKIKK